MGKRANSFAIATAALLLAGATPAAAADQVGLLYMKAGFTFGGAYAYGYAEVQNLGFEKKVTAIYRVAGGDWVEAPATYVAPTHDGLEAWSFATQAVVLGDRQSTTVELKLRYEVAGATYVDDQGGQNYLVGIGFDPSAPTFVLQRSALVLGTASWFPLADPLGDLLGRRLYGTVLLENLAYEKSVQIVYSADGWRTVRTADATYGAPIFGNPLVEVWNFQLDVDPSAASVQFAVHYQYNGASYWDNNFGQNYTVAF
jgi:hypothetical protein